jgi:menaquinone-9 beta-reductase
MIEDCVIVGGGVAGLSSANQLADAGLSPLVIEASQYPGHRICGEFFSHECLPILRRWEISLPGTITRCCLFRGLHKAEFPLPMHSGSCSRFDFDIKLLERAKSRGARVLTETKVISLNLPERSSEPYELLLSDGQTIKARHLMIGTGRIPKATGGQGGLPPKYVGFKAHFEGISLNNEIEMHIFDGGYLGISSIDSKTTNIACIVKKDRLYECNPFDLFMSKLQEGKCLSAFKERLLKARMIFPKWLIGEVPEFGIRTNPAWERVFWIGDAAGSIPPICGEGLAIAVSSGCMAADFFLNSDALEFKKAWLRRYARRFFWAKQIHKILLTSWLSPVSIKACQWIPSVPIYFWKLTREEAGVKP